MRLSPECKALLEPENSHSVSISGDSGALQLKPRLHLGSVQRVLCRSKGRGGFFQVRALNWGVGGGLSQDIRGEIVETLVREVGNSRGCLKVLVFPAS